MLPKLTIIQKLRSILHPTNYSIPRLNSIKRELKQPTGNDPDAIATDALIRTRPGLR